MLFRLPADVLPIPRPAENSLRGASLFRCARAMPIMRTATYPICKRNMLFRADAENDSAICEVRYAMFDRYAKRAKEAANRRVPATNSTANSRTCCAPPQLLAPAPDTRSPRGDRGPFRRESRPPAAQVVYTPARCQQRKRRCDAQPRRRWRDKSSVKSAFFDAQ